MGITTIVKKMQRNLNDFGVKEAFGKGVRYAFKKVYMRRSYRIYRRDLTKEDFPEPRVDGLDLRLVGPAEAGALKQMEDMEEWLHGMLPGIMSHGLCVAAFDRGALVGFNLVAFEWVHISLLNMEKRLLPHQAWSEQITVLRPYRKQGLASALRYRVFSELKSRGIRTFYGGALVSNIPSLKSAAKVGFEPIADVEYLRVLNRERRTWRRIKNAGN